MQGDSAKTTPASEQPAPVANAARSFDPETVEWLLGEARANIAELADDLRGSYVIDKDEPPHLAKAREVIAEIDDLIGGKP